MQASYHCALVAQGALLVYRADDLKSVGGWPDAITEDIIVTWSLLAERGLAHEPLALATTTVSWTLRALINTPEIGGTPASRKLLFIKAESAVVHISPMPESDHDDE